MSVLVTGGVGYIGSHVVRALQAVNRSVVVVDRHRSGYDIRDRIGQVPVVATDLVDGDAPNRIREAIRQYDVTDVVHLAALKDAPQSVAQPALYYRENLGGLANLLTALEGTRVNRFVFSSSAAVYGNPSSSSVREDAPTRPINPYGETKLAGEWLVADAAKALGIRSVSLRYFNVLGTGAPELADRVSHNLLTVAIAALLRGEQPRVFGDDYNTRDGSAIRDYIHVVDLAAAHVAALESLGSPGPAHAVFNVGTGAGATVFEVLRELERVSGTRVEPALLPRRAGDPEQVVADASRIQAEIGWAARHDLADMIGSAWDAVSGRNASAVR